jgi:hypothetical protein
VAGVGLPGGHEQELKALLPMSPMDGPPLPKGLEVKWPWVQERERLGEIEAKRGAYQYFRSIGDPAAHIIAALEPAVIDEGPPLPRSIGVRWPWSKT